MEISPLLGKKWSRGLRLHGGAFFSLSQNGFQIGFGGFADGFDGEIVHQHLKGLR